MLRPTLAYTLVTPPAAEPVTLGEAKAQARIDGTDLDDQITALIVAAREHVELATGRCLVTQTWRLTLDQWPGAERDDWWDGTREAPISVTSAAWVDLEKSPVSAITAVRTLDEDGTATTWAAGNYYLGRHPNGQGRLVRKSGAVWPIVTLRSAGAIEIEFTAGYGASGAAVPYALRHAVKLLVAHWIDCGCEPNEMAVPKPVAALVAQNRVLRI